MRILYRLLIILLVFLPAISASRTFTVAQAQSGAQPEVTSNRKGLVVEWRTPAHQVVLQPDGTSRVVLPGYDQVSLPGAPLVPFSAVLVALPSGAQPRLEVLQLEETQVVLPAPLGLADQPGGVQRTPDGQVFGGAFIPATQPRQFNPGAVVLEPLGSLRGVQLARLVFYPARPDGQLLRLTSRMQVVLHFDVSGGSSLRRQEDLDPLLAALQSEVVNPQHLYARVPASQEPQSTLAAGEDGGPVVAIEIDQAGVVAITYEALAATGLPVAGIDPQELHLTRAGVPIPLEYDGEGSFGPGERLLFYAEPRFSRWTSADVYFLQQASGPGLAIQSRSADPNGLPAGTAWVAATEEQNTIYTPDCLCAPVPAGRDGDRWVWDRLQWPNRASRSYPVDLSSVDPGQSGRLSLWLIGYTDIPNVSLDHRVAVYLNEVWLGEAQWDGKQATHIELDIPAAVLKDGSNQLTLTLPGLPGIEVEGVWLDAFSIRYARSSAPSGEAVLFSGAGTGQAYTLGLDNLDGLRAYEVTDPGQPVRLKDLKSGPGNIVSLGETSAAGSHRYWISVESGIVSPLRLRMVSALRTGNDQAGADYVVISHASFLPALEDLIALRKQQGLAVAVEDVQAIYDTFGDGRPEPDAIRAYLEHAYRTWNPAPVYVLLVGDGTSDPKRYSEGSSTTFIPPYLADVEPWAGETAADNRYVTLDGNDNLPEMLIGRLPVNNLAEAQAVTSKIVQYELSPAPGNWGRTTALVADSPDSGGHFPNLSDQFASLFSNPPWKVERLYLPSLEPEAVAAVRQALIEQWNAGAGLLMFTGHASVHQWSKGQLLHIDDLPHMKNGARLPVLLEMTCFTGSFQVPGMPTLDEALLRHPSGGVVAAWGSTGLGISTGHGDLAGGFLKKLVSPDQVDLGTAALAGKLNLATHNPAFIDLVDTFTLLGDPAMQMKFAAGSQPIYLPIIQK